MAKEKLVELLTDCEAKGFWYYGKDCKTGEHGGHEMTAEDIADYLAENIASKWISVKDRLPENYERVLICGAYKFLAVGRVMNGHWVVSWNNDEAKGVTHWMPLPQPPKGE